MSRRVIPTIKNTVSRLTLIIEGQLKFLRLQEYYTKFEGQWKCSWILLLIRRENGRKSGNIIKIHYHLSNPLCQIK